MLERFEKVWTKNAGVQEQELSQLYSWLINNDFPCRELSKSYIDLLKESNGGNFTNGEREYQFFTAAEVAEYYDAYSFSKFMPFALPFAMDGCGNFYIFKLSFLTTKIYATSAANMGWKEDECCYIAHNFDELLKQEQSLDDRMNMRRVIAFVVDQYALGDTAMNEKPSSLNNYRKSHKIVLRKNQMLISGRACASFKEGDILVSEKNSQIYVEGFHLYGRELNFISSGSTCCIICQVIEEKLFEGQYLFL